ncbi:MAG: hypothetical protein U0521_22380 [Anaerolineae bacterium]
MEVTLRLGNPGWADKTVDIVLHDPGWSEVVTCQFALGGVHGLRQLHHSRR